MFHSRFIKYANLDVKTWRGGENRSVLHYAINGTFDHNTVGEVLALGADVNAVDSKGYTGLHLIADSDCVEGVQPEIVELFLDREDFDLEAKAADGRTACDMARERCLQSEFDAHVYKMTEMLVVRELRRRRLKRELEYERGERRRCEAALAPEVGRVRAQHEREIRNRKRKNDMLIEAEIENLKRLRRRLE